MGKGNYISEIPHLMKEWDWKANANLDPSKITYGSGQKAWWICSKGHRWLSEIRDRISRKSNCPYCHGRKVLAGFNDLATTHPELAKEWNYTKNKSLLPSQVKAGSNKKVWWICSKGHEWFAQISSRTYLRSNCPCCGHHQILTGFNDLATTNPELAKEWNYEKNAPLLPTQVFEKSPRSVWWVCPKGHEFKKEISNRKVGCGCPVCSKERQTSFPEQAIFYYVKRLYPDAINSYRASFLGKMELDIYIPSLKWAIEYDGAKWHKKDRLKDEQKKYQKCVQQRIKLIRIREQMAELGSDISDEQIGIVRLNGVENIEETIKYIIKHLNFSRKAIDINLGRDRIKILQNALSYEKKNSLANLNPPFLKEWNYEKNGKLKPEFFTAFSGKKVWWKCSKGHEWEAAINNRRIGHNCPYCSNQKVLPGYNDLATVHPELAQEWNYEKNFPLTPQDYITGSNKLVWWKCAKGHEWKASIANRIKGASLRGIIKGTQCPYCSNQKVQAGFNDLATTHPDLAKEWDYDKNGSARPDQIIAGSNKKVWWKCSKGHEWKTSVACRRKGTGCPYCLNHKIIPGENDFASQHPEFLKEWDYKKNSPLLPTQIGSGSEKKVWWICSKCGREWQAMVCNRVKCHNLYCRCCNIRESKRNKSQLLFDF